MRLQLYPPLLLTAGRSAPFLNVSGEGKAGAAKAITLSDIYPYPQKEFSPLLGGLEQGTESVCAAVRCAWASAPTADVKPEVQFSAWVIPEGSDLRTELPVNLLGVANQDQIRVCLLEFKLPDLRPGSYSLHVTARDPVTNSTSETVCTLSVVPSANK